MRRLLFVLVVVAGCTKADPVPSPSPAPAPAPGVAFAEPPPTTPTPPAPTPPPPAAPLDVSVQLTAVTLADDCGGATQAGAARAKSARSEPSGVAAQRYQRRCEQTSMQLALRASAVAKIEIKSVELLDEHGKSLGMLAARSPTQWSQGASRYTAWDETLAADTPLKVSYMLQQPNWAKIGNRWNRTYTLKTVVSIGGVDKSVTKNVTLEAPTILSPNVRT